MSVMNKAEYEKLQRATLEERTQTAIWKTCIKNDGTDDVENLITLHSNMYWYLYGKRPDNSKFHGAGDLERSIQYMVVELVGDMNKLVPLFAMNWEKITDEN